MIINSTIQPKIHSIFKTRIGISHQTFLEQAVNHWDEHYSTAGFTVEQIIKPWGCQLEICNDLDPIEDYTPLIKYLNDLIPMISMISPILFVETIGYRDLDQVYNTGMIYLNEDHTAFEIKKLLESTVKPVEE